MDTCVSCQIFTNLDHLAQSYGRDAFELLAPATKVAFNAFVGCWIAWTLVVNGIIRGDLKFQAVVSRVIIFTLCDVALNSSDLYWQWVYQPAYEAMNGIATTIVAKDATGLDVRDLTGMLSVVEEQIMQILKLCLAVMKDAGITTLWLLVAGAVLAIPFVFVWGIFLAFVLEGIFKLLGITAVSPLLIACAGFGATRGFAISGLRVVLGGVLTVVFAAVAMGFTLEVTRYFTGKIPMNADGLTIRAADWVMSGDYWGMLLLGFVSVLFHLKAATLASNISGASDGPGAAAAVVAGGMTALAAVKGAAMTPVRNAMKAAGDTFGAKANHDRIWRRGGNASPGGEQQGGH